MKKKKLFTFFLAFVMSCQSTIVSYAQETDVLHEEEIAKESIENLNSKTYLSQPQLYNGIQDRYAIPEGDVDYVKSIGSMSLTVSFKTTSNSLMALAALNSDSHQNSYISLYVNNGNTLGVELRDAQGNVNKGYTQNVGSFNDDSWHTATFVIEENVGYRLYFDQDMVKEVSDNQTYCTKNMKWQPASVTFGGAHRISGNNYAFIGEIKNAKIYNGTLSNEQVLRDHGGVVLKDPIVTYDRNVFDGLNSSIVSKDEDHSKIDNLEQETFAFAYKLNNTDNRLNALFSLSQKDVQNGYGAIYINPANGRLGFEIRNGAGHQYVTIPDEAAKNTNWHTAAIAFDGQQATFYFDGNNIGSVPATGTLRGNDWNVDSVTIGGIQRNSSSKWAFNGTINRVDIFDTALQDDEIAQLNKLIKPEDILDYEKGVIKTEEYGLFDIGG